MRVFDFLKQHPMKGKIKAIKDDMASIVSNFCDKRFTIEWYGAYEIDPKHLVYWICVQTDEMKMKLKSNEKLISKLKELLEKHDYPQEARSTVKIGFESQETVDRESDGDWHLHLQ